MRQVRIASHIIQVADDQPTFWDRVEAGLWEPGTLAVYRQRVGPGMLVIDLGTWVGPLALYAAALGAEVIAVEADPAALDQLRRNVAVNPDLAPRITILERAVAPEAGTVRLGARRKPGDSMSSALLADAETSWSVTAVTPAELAAMTAKATRLLVKLDIEGGEYRLLPALAPLLARPGTSLLVSFHPAILRESREAAPRATMAAALAALEGLRSYAVGPDGPEPAVPDAAALERIDTWLFVRD